MNTIIFVLQLIVGSVYIYQVESMDKHGYLDLTVCLEKKRNAKIVWEKRRDTVGDTEIIFIGCK